MADDCSVLIHGGTIVDGTGTPPMYGDLAVDGQTITGIHERGAVEGTVTIDATGMMVCPGFIDIHTHSDISLLCCPLAESKIRQGVTTEVVGNCGWSAAPIVGRAGEPVSDVAEVYGVDVDWSSMDEYLLRLGLLGTSVNVATYVGADTVRHGVIGAGDVKPTKDQMGCMEALVREAMADGAFGLSTGLIYAPGCYASTEEIIGLASVTSPFEGLYSSHIRGEGSTLLRAVNEALRIGRKACVRVQISHHKAAGVDNWGLVAESMRMIEHARASGVDVAFDVYPYIASCTTLHSVLPPWVQDGGKERILERMADPDLRERIKADLEDRNTRWENTIAEDSWENIEVLGFRKEGNRRFERRRMTEVAEMLGRSPPDAAFDLMIEEGLGLMAIFHEMSEDDVVSVIRHPLSSIASDGETGADYGPCREVPTHPRSFGTFPRALRRYVFEKHVASLEEMVRKMTSSPAARIGLTDRGVISEGMRADIAVFDPETVRDEATFEEPYRYAHGMAFVLVNGVITINDGQHTKERAGVVLRKAPPAPRER
ncbi:MAG: D-aminoacylase [Methanobacteriota archaeon]|nr:MAG: D-aminoacylase [Euryarchaeota archaeon]